MNGAELDTLVRGIVDVAAIAAVWSLLFFKRVKVSSPAQPRAGRAAGKQAADGGAPAPDAGQDGGEQAVTPIGRAA